MTNLLRSQTSRVRAEIIEFGLDDNWADKHDVRRRLDQWAVSTIEAKLEELAEEGVIERKKFPYRGSQFVWKYRQARI